jgi:2-(1,2-epoxy-1,2-dihydrophenyl)acetyl-CoA isomerase
MTAIDTPLVTVDLDVSCGLALVEFSRPPHNFFDVELISAIAEAYAELDADPRCRAIVLASPGRHFCAGADFSNRILTEVDSTRLYRQAARLFSFSVPVVAAVQGRAVGGGLGLAMSADFRIAAPSSKFVCNFSRLGTHHGFGLSVTLPAVIGQQRALELLYCGSVVTGTRAAEIGLCDQLVDEAEVRSAALAYAQNIARSAPLAVRAIRRTMWSAKYPAMVAEATEIERLEQAQLFATEDFREGVRAAAERRPPAFVGR